MAQHVFRLIESLEWLMLASLYRFRLNFGHCGWSRSPAMVVEKLKRKLLDNFEFKFIGLLRIMLRITIDAINIS